MHAQAFNSLLLCMRLSKHAFVDTQFVGAASQHGWPKPRGESSECTRGEQRCECPEGILSASLCRTLRADDCIKAMHADIGP